ncbi:TetR/AcrR family transcriptional regulator [Alkanindiges sp. WGS2144]|uniref:TetR/AcrR family transcriptional regulator n=1 Tax=Alkanindiges sp. WGS2144 TaxID=3366808 RepID=UPI003752C272
MRKQPKQQRAKELVGRILQVTEDYIAQHGLSELTTPKISEQSGVGVGSIYQYFSNKQEIVECLLEQKSHALGQALKEYVLCHRASQLEDLLRGAIEFGFEQLRANNGFYIEIIRHLHQLNTQKPMEILQNHFFELWVFVLGKFFQGTAPDKINIKAFIVINSTLYTIINYCSQNPPKFTDDEVKQELSSMIIGYLNSTH